MGADVPGSPPWPADSLTHWTALTLHLDAAAARPPTSSLPTKSQFFRTDLAMSRVQSAKLNKIDPWAHLRNVPARIHGHPAARIEELLPHRWRPD